MKLVYIVQVVHQKMTTLADESKRHDSRAPQIRCLFFSRINCYEARYGDSLTRRFTKGRQEISKEFILLILRLSRGAGGKRMGLVDLLTRRYAGIAHVIHQAAPERLSQVLDYLTSSFDRNAYGEGRNPG